MNIPNWFNDTIGEELARLYTLNLEGCPAADVLKFTKQSWAEDLYEHLQFAELTPERDLGRIRAAFRALRLNCTRWPVPKLFLQHLPERAPLPRLPTSSKRTRADRIVKVELDRRAMGLEPLNLLLPEDRK